MARAYDSWSPIQKTIYKPDGTMNEEYRKRLMSEGTSLFDTFSMEAIMQKEVKDFEEREENFKKRWGMTFSEWDGSGQGNLSPAEQKKRQQLALDEGAELSELPLDMEPDEYYDHYADYSG